MNLIKIRFQWILGSWQASYVGGPVRFTFGSGRNKHSALCDLIAKTTVDDFDRLTNEGIEPVEEEG